MKKIIGISGLAGSGKDTVASFINEILEGRTKRLALADPLKEFARDVFDFPRDALWGPSEARNRPDERYADDTAWMNASNRFSGRCVDWVDEVVGDWRLCPFAYKQLQDWFYGLRDSKRFNHVQGYAPITPREVLQTLGTEWGRSVDFDIWIDAGMRKAEELLRERDTHAVLITDVRFLNEARKLHVANHETWMVKRSGAGLAGSAGTHASELDMCTTEMQSLMSRTIVNDEPLAVLKARVGDALGTLKACDEASKALP